MHDVKEKIRKEITHKLQSQKKEDVFEKSRIIKQKLFSLSEFKKAKFVMFYASKENEVDTSEMIDEALELGKEVALPHSTSLRTIIPKKICNRNKDLEKGTYGIWEPKSHQENVRPERIDLVIVPGIAFDKKMRRLGRGKAYYDKFLKGLPSGIVSIGLAFDFQIVENLPEDSHDIPVSKIITN